MNYAERLEIRQSRALTTAIAKHVGDDYTRFKELAKLVFGTDKILQQRAAWPFSEIILTHHNWLKAYWKKCAEVLKDESLHEALHRNLLRCLQVVEIPEDYQASILDTCLKAIMSERRAIAVRAFSISVAAAICKEQPELKRELRLILNELAQRPMNAALRVRVKRALKVL
jgi:hypothetical protein